jgi:hypothetical protein
MNLCTHKFIFFGDKITKNSDNYLIISRRQTLSIS